MAPPPEPSDILFSEYCPVLGRTVILFRKTWIYKICARAAHPQMRNKEQMVQQVIRDAKEANTLWWQPTKLKTKPFIQVEASQLSQKNSYLRIGLQITDDKTAIITTAFPTKRFPTGAKQYE